jgi:hypothetical protein
MRMGLRLTIAFVLSFACLTTSAWADYQAGMDANNRGDYATALRKGRPLAERGMAAAQFKLGQLYANGQGVPQDYAQARQWWEKAAVRGDVEAAANLGTLYLNGQGGSKMTGRPWTGFVGPQLIEMQWRLHTLASCTSVGAACRRMLSWLISGTSLGQRTEIN